MTETTALPPVVSPEEWRRELDALRVREKAATRELDAIAAQRRRLPMVELPGYTLQRADGPVRLVEKVGNRMEWYSTAGSDFGPDMGAPPNAGFAVNVFLRDGDTVYRTWHTDGRGTEQIGSTTASSTSFRSAGKRSGRMCPTAGRSTVPTTVERARKKSLPPTAPAVLPTRTEAKGLPVQSVVLGGGTPYFAKGFASELALIGSEQLPDGVVLTRYAPAPARG